MAIHPGALEAVDGYHENVITAEDDELNVRQRAAVWHIWRLQSEMTLDDASTKPSGQWWLRIAGMATPSGNARTPSVRSRKKLESFVQATFRGSSQCNNDLPKL
jgi:hypothetical protein